MTPTLEQYIDHEVRIRVQDEQIKSMDSKLNLIISLVMGGLFLPIVLSFLKIN